MSVVEQLTAKHVIDGIEDKVDLEAVELMLLAVPEDPNAGLLIRQMISFSATYDHVVDGDKFTKDDVHSMVDILLRGLIQNPFYVRHVNVFVPIIINAIHAWRYADDCPEYRIKVADVLSELGSSMLYLSGGTKRLAEWGNHWRDMIIKLLKDSDNTEE